MLFYPIYTQVSENEARLDCTRYFNGTDGKFYEYASAEEYSKLPKMLPIKVAQDYHQQNKIIFNMYQQNKAGIVLADQRNTVTTARVEVNQSIPTTQKLQVKLNAVSYTGDEDFFYVSLGGGAKTNQKLALPNLPSGVTIGGTDGTATVTNFNDFAKNGYVLKGCQITASNKNLFDSVGKVLQIFSLPVETANNLNTEEVNMQYGIDPSANSPEFRKFTENGENSFYAKIDPLQGIILGVAKGLSVTFTFTFYSSGNSAGVYALAPQ